MDISQACMLIENLLDRIERNPETGKYHLGVISSREKDALQSALASLRGEADETISTPTVIERVPDVQPAPALPEVILNVRAMERTQPESPEITMCLDFGTAMSKAFAIAGSSTPVELALGKRAGSSGYPVESSLFISDDGVLHFGPQAVELGTHAITLGRTRFDSPKSRLSMGKKLDINRVPLAKDKNPFEAIPMSEGEMITLYLAYLTDLAGTELSDKGYSRYCARRFARPCWDDDRNQWAEPLLRRMLAQAQILADTFTGRWLGGIPLAEAKQALIKLNELAVQPDYLLAQEGIPEPVAAASSLMLTDEAQRELFLVMDVGAGTTDFGVFLLQHNPDKEVCKVRIIPDTIKYLPQAGNRVDELLKLHVLELEGVDIASPEGRHNADFLDSTIRLHKEALLRDGTVAVPMANKSRVMVDRQAFLESPRVEALTRLLESELAAVLECVNDGYLDLMRDTHLNVVLTGGGATLPMIQRLATGVIEVRSRKIMRRAAPKVPSWVTESYPQFESQYPQLAVAIGGANPDLPELAESVADFKGLSGRTYSI